MVSTGEFQSVLLGEPLSLEVVEAVALNRATPELAPDARARLSTSRAAVERLLDAGDAAPRLYGINTGFGALADQRIGATKMRELQLNLIRSHCSGVGSPMSEPEVRAMMLLRAHTLALGHSGVRPAVVDLLIGMLKSGIIAYVPSQGSVGASGDLAPLAHLALAMLGQGRVSFQGEWMDAGEALARAGLAPIQLEAKEGLSLINGTQFMVALGVLGVLESLRLSTVADIAGAMSLEALKGSERPFEERLMKLRPHPGQMVSAANLRRLLSDSEIMVSHHDCDKVQDPYSLRCMPQVHGATRDALEWAREVLEREVNSVTDNPCIFESGEVVEVVSGGNFHGQPVAYALDLAAIAVSELADISERRVEQLVNPALSSGLTPFLARESGLHNGFMIAQVAAASLVSENRVLCHPASTDSIPSSAGREDHVSMGSVSARKLGAIVTNVRRALAIELLTASAGLDQRAPLRPGTGAAAAHSFIRTHIAPLYDDRPLYEDIEQVAQLIKNGELLKAVEARIG
ncbi:MAG TPA: histidine ammonia-lyase, partial [Polyangiaceae bacterium]